MDEIRVTVIMLCYNHEPYIRKALDGVLSQKTDFPVRVVVHDDASTDGSGNVIREYAARYPQIVPLIEPENCHMHGHPYRLDIQPHVTGDYVAMCECDDYWTCENKLQMQVEFMDRHPEVSATYHNCGILFEGHVTEEKKREKESMYRHRKEGYFTLDQYAASQRPGQTASIVERKSVYEIRHDPEFPMVKIGMNSDLCSLTAAMGSGKVYTFEKTMSVHRVVMGYGSSYTERMKKVNVTGKNLVQCVWTKKYLEEQTGEPFRNDHLILAWAKKLLTDGFLRPDEHQNRNVMNTAVRELGGGWRFFMLMIRCLTNYCAYKISGRHRR